MSSRKELLRKIRYVKVGGKTYDVNKEIKVDATNLSRAFEQHAEKAHFWFRVHASEASRLNRMEDELRELEYMRFKQYVEVYKEEKRGFTDDLIWAEVHFEESVFAKRREVWKVRERVKILKAVCDAFEHRKSSLISLGAMIRREADGELTSKRR